MFNFFSQFANILSVEVTAIKRVEKWANCWFVVASGIGARFVSFKSFSAKAALKAQALEALAGYGLSLVDVRNSDMERVTDLVYKLFRCGDSLREAAYGIRYAIATARIDGRLSMVLESKDGLEITDLLAEIASNGLMSGDVAHWLNANYEAIAPELRSGAKVILATAGGEDIPLGKRHVPFGAVEVDSIGRLKLEERLLMSFPVEDWETMIRTVRYLVLEGAKSTIWEGNGGQFLSYLCC